VRKLKILMLMTMISATASESASAQQDDKLMIYQMMPRLFGNKQSQNIPYGTIAQNGSGKFNDINDKAIGGIKEMGITHIWYTGVIAHASLTDYSKFGIPTADADVVKGRAGSPYAIRDYYDVDPDLAVDVKNRMKEFEALLARTHKSGLKVLLTLFQTM
jgi:glycosidase